MSLDARLNRLMPTLTARERAILILRSWKEDAAEDPYWRSSMPSDQAREFNRLIGLMNACNVQLAYYVALVATNVAKVDVRSAWLLTLWAWRGELDETAWQIEQLVPAAKRRTKAYRELQERLAYREELDQQRISPDGIAMAQEQLIREVVPERWSELRAAEVVAAEVALEFDGEDPLRPYVREALDESKERLEKARLLLEYQDGRPLPELREPDEEQVKALRVRFRRWAVG